MGYSSNITKSCPDVTISDDNNNVASGEYVYTPKNGGYHFCVYKFTLCDEVKSDDTCKEDSNETYYYKVTTFMHFDIPLIGQVLEFPVSGETKTFYNTFINIKE